MTHRLLAIFLIAATICHGFATGAQAQIQRVRTEVTAGPMDRPTEEMIVSGVGALAGLGVGFLLLEGGVSRAFTLLGYTHRTVVPVFFMLAGSVATRLLFLDWRESVVR